MLSVCLHWGLDIWVEICVSAVYCSKLSPWCELVLLEFGSVLQSALEIPYMQKVFSLQLKEWMCDMYSSLFCLYPYSPDFSWEEHSFLVSKLWFLKYSLALLCIFNQFLVVTLVTGLMHCFCSC